MSAISAVTNSVLKKMVCQVQKWIIQPQRLRALLTAYNNWQGHYNYYLWWTKFHICEIADVVNVSHRLFIDNFMLMAMSIMMMCRFIMIWMNAGWCNVCLFVISSLKRSRKIFPLFHFFILSKHGYYTTMLQIVDLVLIKMVLVIVISLHPKKVMLCIPVGCKGRSLLWAVTE